MASSSTILAEGSPLVKLRVVEAIGRIQDPADAARLIPLLAGHDRRSHAKPFSHSGNWATPPPSHRSSRRAPASTMKPD